MTPREIRARRLAYPLTPRELAEKLGISAGAVRSWERGDRAPYPKQKARLLQLFQKREGCRCTCHGIAPRPYKPAWTPEEDRYLIAEVQRGLAPKTISQNFSREFDVARTIKAVYTRARYLGLEFSTGLSGREVRRKLGVTNYRFRQFIHQGLLPVSRGVSLTSGDATDWWRISPEDLENFVQEQVGILFHPQDIPDSRLRVSAYAAFRKKGRSA